VVVAGKFIKVDGVYVDIGEVAFLELTEQTARIVFRSGIELKTPVGTGVRASEHTYMKLAREILRRFGYEEPAHPTAAP
jgi:hypothetical protein